MSEHPMIRSLEAEKAVIGAVLQDKDNLNSIMDIIKPDDFDSPAHKRILECLLSLQDRGQPPDLVLLSTELGNRGILDKIGGPAYLAELADASPVTGNITYYARIVREKAIARRIIEAARRMIARVHEPDGEGTDSLIAYAQEQILTVSRAITGPSGIKIRNAVHHTFKDIEERSQKGTILAGLSTGFTGLDAVTGGLKQRHLYIIAGRPGSGKTAFVLNVARNVAAVEGQVIFFSLEMSFSELSLRLISAETGIDGHRLSRGILWSEEWPRCGKAVNTLAQLSMEIDDTGGLPIDRLMARARRIKAEEGLVLVIADYLQLIRPFQKWGVREQEVAEVSRSLKALAKELNVPVLATSQLNRAIENRQNKRPTLGDLRESGAIEQDADVIAFLWPVNDSGEDTDLIIAKHRQGPTGEVALIFDRKRTQFKDRQTSRT